MFFFLLPCSVAVLLCAVLGCRAGSHALGRLALLRLLNMIVSEVLPLIDFGPSRANWSLAHKYVINGVVAFTALFVTPF